MHKTLRLNLKLERVVRQRKREVKGSEAKEDQESQQSKDGHRSKERTSKQTGRTLQPPNGCREEFVGVASSRAQRGVGDEVHDEKTPKPKLDNAVTQPRSTPTKPDHAPTQPRPSPAPLHPTSTTPLQTRSGPTTPASYCFLSCFFEEVHIGYKSRFCFCLPSLPITPRKSPSWLSHPSLLLPSALPLLFLLVKRGRRTASPKK